MSPDDYETGSSSVEYPSLSDYTPRITPASSPNPNGLREERRTVYQPTSRREVALWYARKFGWLCLPAWGKIPRVSWNEGVLPELPGLDALDEWWRADPDANIAVLTGRRSGIVVGDVDPRHGGRLETLWERGWPENTAIVRTGGEKLGWHVYCRYPMDGERMASVDTYAVGVEVKADGKLVIAPPSRHPDTKRHYEWEASREPWVVGIAPLPDAVVAEIRSRQPVNVGTKAEPLEPLTEDEVERRWPRAMGLVREAVERAHERRDNGRHNTLVWLANRLYLMGFTPGLPGDPLRRCLLEYQRLVERGWAE